MTKQKRQVRRERVKRMNRVLNILFPDATIALNYSNAWELLVAVILSAQCTDKRVNQITEVLFKKYSTFSDYVKADIHEFERDIKSCGFFRSKAKNILGAAHRIEKCFNGQVPDTMEDLLTLPGVARKTANVVLLNVFGRAVGIAVDTHVRRFVIRFDLSDFTDPVRIERDLLEVVPQSAWGTFNHQLVLYGREICGARKHDCANHPLTKLHPQAQDIWPKART